MPVIKARDVRRYFSGIPVLQSVSLTVEKGEIYSLYGMPESGKTVFIKILLDLINRDSGLLRIFDRDPSIFRREVLLNIGYVPQNPRYPPWYTLEDIIKMKNRIYRKMDLDSYIRILSDHGLWRYRDKKLMKMDEVRRRTLSLVVSITHDPELIIIDDLRMIQEDVLKDIFERYRGRKTFFISTNDLTTVEQFTDKIGFLNDGNIYFQGAPNQLKRIITNSTVLIKLSESREEVWKKIGRIEELKDISIADKMLKVKVTGNFGIIGNIKQILRKNRVDISWIKWIYKGEEENGEDAE